MIPIYVWFCIDWNEHRVLLILYWIYGDRSHSAESLNCFILIWFSQSSVSKLICALSEYKKNEMISFRLWTFFNQNMYFVSLLIRLFNIWIVNEKPVSRQLNILIDRRTFVVVIVILPFQYLNSILGSTDSLFSLFLILSSFRLDHNDFHQNV